MTEMRSITIEVPEEIAQAIDSYILSFYRAAPVSISDEAALKRGYAALVIICSKGFCRGILNRGKALYGRGFVYPDTDIERLA